MAQSMQKQLDKIERIEVEQFDTAAMNLRFPPAPRSGQVVLEAKKLSKSYSSLNVLDKVNLKLDRGDRVAFVGQNGQGKTTLAKIIVNELTLTGGELELGHNVEIGYYAQNQSDSLHAKLTVLETMENFAPAEMRTQLRSILGAFMFSGEDADKKVSVLSGGERARLALACLLLRPFNLLVLDEPTNHLDIISKDVLKQAIQDYEGTLIIVSHDREFLGNLTERTLEFRDRKLHEHLGDVNYFLEKRQLDNMRDVEISQSSGKPKAKQVEEAPPKKELSYEDRKRLQRAISNAEKKVEKIEADIKKMEKTMSNPEFYLSDDAAEVAKKHVDLKAALEDAIEIWELAQLEMMEYE
jgi:ATP-binding cassette subfamily F protein 3